MSFSSILYFLFNIFSHSPNFIVEILVYILLFWFSDVVIWYKALSSSINISFFSSITLLIIIFKLRFIISSLISFLISSLFKLVFSSAIYKPKKNFWEDQLSKIDSLLGSIIWESLIFDVWVVWIVWVVWVFSVFSVVSPFWCVSLEVFSFVSSFVIISVSLSLHILSSRKVSSGHLSKHSLLY